MRNYLAVLFVFLVCGAHAGELESKLAHVNDTAKSFELKTGKSCAHLIRFDVSDFLFQRDEIEAFDLYGVEQGQILSRLLGEACARLKSNRDILAKVGTVVMKRGSLDDRKLLKLKSGDLMYFAAGDPRSATRNWDDLIKEDLVGQLGLDFKSEDKPTPAGPTNREVKYDALKKWFAEESKRIVMKNSPTRDKELEALTNEFKEKTNAIFTSK